MISVRVKIGSGSIVDTSSTYGLVYIDSDKRVGSPVKGFESTAYPDEEGEHIIPVTVDAPFDYKVKFFIQARALPAPTTRSMPSTKPLLQGTQRPARARSAR